MTTEQRAAARERCSLPLGYSQWRIDLPAALEALDAADVQIDSLRQERDEKERLLRAAELLNERWNRAASKTRCGSEFIDDPERVFEAVMETARSNFETVKGAIRRARAAELRIEEWRRPVAEPRVLTVADVAELRIRLSTAQKNSPAKIASEGLNLPSLLDSHELLRAQNAALLAWVETVPHEPCCTHDHCAECELPGMPSCRLMADLCARFRKASCNCVKSKMPLAAQTKEQKS